MEVPKQHAVGRMRLLVLAAAPVVMVVVGVFSLLNLANWYHAGQLPDDYQSFNTERFQVYHPEGLEGRAKAIVEEAEAFLLQAPLAFSPFLGDLTPPERQVRLTLFRNQEEFIRFTQDSLQEDMSSNGGYFDAANLEIVLVLTKSNADSLGIRHEVAHLLVARGGGRFGTEMPRWLNEGLATWLETADVSAPGSSGLLADWVRLVAAATAVPPGIQEIVAFDGKDFRSENNDLVYAYSNLLIHFLMHHSQERFFAFARSVLEGKPADVDRFEGAFGSVTNLEEPFRRYVRRLVSDFDAEYRERVIRGETLEF